MMFCWLQALLGKTSMGLNENLAVDSFRQIVSPEDHGITWLGHLIEDDSIVAEDGHKCSITPNHSNLRHSVSFVQVAVE